MTTKITMEQAKANAARLRANLGLSRLRMDAKPAANPYDYFANLCAACLDVPAYEHLDVERWRAEVLEAVDAGIPWGDAVRASWFFIWVDGNMNGDSGLWVGGHRPESLPPDDELGLGGQF